MPTADALDDIMQSLNERGWQCSLLLIDATDVPFMAFGEDRSDSDLMTCWLTPSDPGSGDYDRPAEHYEQDYGLPALEWPLTAARYPVEVVGPREALAAIVDSGKRISS